MIDSLLGFFERADVWLCNRRAGLWILGCMFLATRLPFIANGYGIDSDAWRVVYQAFRMSVESHYFPSRLPGYPLFELLNILLLPLGWMGTNLATATVSAIAILVFWRILHLLNANLPLLFTLGMAFTPVFWVNSVTTMDYVWALALLLVSFGSLLRGQVLFASLMLGIAVGFRPTSGVFLLPSLVYLGAYGAVALRGRLEKAFLFISVFAVAAVVAFSPVLLTYGLNVLPALSGRPALLAAGYHGTVEIFGALGFFAVALLAVYVVLTMRKPPQKARAPEQTNFSRAVRAYALTAVAVSIALFMLYPDEGGYLIPAVPFAWLLLAIYIQSSVARRLAFAVVLLVIVSNFIDLRFWSRDEWGSRVLTTPYLGTGLLIEDAQQRQSDMLLASEILTLAQSPKVIVMAGWRMPIARALNEVPSLRSKPTVPPERIVDLLPRAELEGYLAGGYRIYFGPGVRSMSLSVLGYDPSTLANASYFDNHKSR
jgi:hypothetical protein